MTNTIINDGTEAKTQSITHDDATAKAVADTNAAAKTKNHARACARAVMDDALEAVMDTNTEVFDEPFEPGKMPGHLIAEEVSFYFNISERDLAFMRALCTGPDYTRRDDEYFYEYLVLARWLATAVNWKVLMKQSRLQGISHHFAA